MTILDAVVIAGGTPEPEDVIYPATLGKPKALVDICGKPMTQWVLDALSGAESVGNVVLIGLPENCGISCSKIKAYLPDQGSIIDNVLTGIRKAVEINPESRHILLVSGDVPGISAEMVNWVVNTSMQSDEQVYYLVIERKVMEGRYPESRRSYLRLKDVDVCGGDVNVIATSLATENRAMWERLVESRKNALKQASLMGYDTLLLVLMHRISLDGAIKKVTKRLNVTGRALLSPYAELGMDVDKPFQLELMRADLCRIS